MSERITEMPAGTVGVRVAGEVEREDYRDVLVPVLRRALWADAKLGFDLGVRHHGDWVRSAIVTDLDWMARATRLFAWMIPGEALVFETAALESAKQRVADDAS